MRRCSCLASNWSALPTSRNHQIARAETSLLYQASSVLLQKATYKKTNKTWFSRTYKPKFGHWMVEKPDSASVDFGLTESNTAYLNEKSLVLPNSPLINQPMPRRGWKENGKRTVRSGVIGIKIGVVPQWTVTGKRILCTMLQVLDNHVINYVPPGDFARSAIFQPKFKNKGYGYCVVGAISASPLEFSEEYNQLFTKSGVLPKRKLTKFVVTEDAAIAPGTPLSAQHFRVGDYMDIQARTVEMGFQGVCTRWGMKGGRASHGVTKAHRRMGSMGGGGDKGGVWRGKKMPGHMGSAWTYHRSLQIVRINTKYNVIYLKGPNLPGPPRAYVRMMDSLLRPHLLARDANPPPMPTFYPEDAIPDSPENIYHESLFTYDDDFVSYENVDKDKLFLYSKPYILYGGCQDGRNHSYRRGI
ncbi:large ribosomal subunit protein uL3-like [Watersipora subatra]|uniref:large ribosomal subunit protein uL3-like n=1 Tax=Watersipora subatra TaxID=2589382 RepID=UPI00355BD4D4